MELDGSMYLHESTNQEIERDGEIKSVSYHALTLECTIPHHEEYNRLHPPSAKDNISLHFTLDLKSDRMILYNQLVSLPLRC